MFWSSSRCIGPIQSNGPIGGYGIRIDEMETCYFCKGRVVKKKIEHLHRWGSQVILLQDVPAEVCEQCGEVYFSPKVLDLMDEITLKHTEPKATLIVPIFSLPDLITA
jgi:YgiT-type zinc finger domain-containing protein